MILALSNSKGGVGKTTIAVHLAVWMAEQGLSVGFVDADVQASSSLWLDEAAPQIKKIRLPSREDIEGQLPGIAEEFDYVVVDGPAGLSEVTRAILCLADVAVLPCGPSVLDLRAAIDAQNVIRQIQKARGGPPVEVVIPNKLQSQYKLSKELLQTVREMGMPAGNGLSLRQAYADAAGQGKVVWKMASASAREATAELQLLFQQLINHESDSPKHDRRAPNPAPA